MLKELPIIANNAIKDMLDEWVLSLCIVLSVAAIACPLLILFGLKQGVIQTVRDQFINDPVYRQITPKETVEYADDFFSKLETDSRIATLIPNITRGASVAQVVTADGTKTRNIDVHSSQPGDPLLTMNGAQVPAIGEIVVSASLAKKYAIEAGQDIDLSIGRRYNNKKQTAVQKARVIAILNARANQSNAVYVPLELTKDIENFRFGRQVNREGWPSGDLPKTRERYDAVIVGCANILDTQLVSKATIRTEFKSADDLGHGGLTDYWPFARNNDLLWYAFKAIGGATTERNIKLLRSELRGHGCQHYLRWVEKRKVIVEGAPRTLIGLSVQTSAQELFPLSFVLAKNQPYKTLQKAYSPSDTTNVVLPVVAAVGKSQVQFKITVAGTSSDINSDTLVVPVEMLARLRSGDEMAIALDQKSGEVIVGDLGFSGFRLYAKSIDDVPALAAHVSTVGNVEVLAKTDDIVRAKLLDQGLTKIVFVVALVGLIGGAGALIASLVASVERKKTEMGTYRLIGFNRHSVAFFPVFQGVLISVLASVIAGVFYYLFSGIVDQVLGGRSMAVGSDQPSSIVQIHLSQFVYFVFGVVLIAIVCALIAARRSLKIDPAEALRQE